MLPIVVYKVPPASHLLANQVDMKRCVYIQLQVKI